MSSTDRADIYARDINAMTDSVATGTRMATNILFAGIEASRATTNYARHNSNEIARLTSILRGSLDRMQKIQVGRLQEGRYSDIPTGAAASTMIKTTETTESKETDASRRK